MKRLIAFLAVLGLVLNALPAAGQIVLKDVPADHWAAKAVYDLVKLGVTQGYPDGTFRGKKNITRYEAAILISKLAEVAGASGMEKLASELRAEMKAFKAEMAAMKKGGAPVSGSLDVNYMLGNVITQKDNAGNTAAKGPLANYRLMTTLSHNLGDGASVAVNLDTMDRAYFVLAVGCTGGKHRSVAVVTLLEERLRAKGYCPCVVHRDL